MSCVSVVTGANSGIGRATAIYLAQQGHRVFGTVRDTARAAKLNTMAKEAGVDISLVELDVADDSSVASGFRRILDAAGAVDVLVNNAGVGGNAVVEDCTPQLMLDVMNVNVCGALRCLSHVLPGMRDRRSGAIVNITSVAGRYGAIAQAPYVASKWALEGLSEELAIEVAPFGIRVVIVEPGITKSAIFAKNVDVPSETAYDAAYRRLMSFYGAGIPNATDPFEVARVIHGAVTTDTPKLRYACSWGGKEFTEGRARISDEGWVALGQTADDDEYIRRLLAAVGLEIPAAPAPH